MSTPIAARSVYRLGKIRADTPPPLKIIFHSENDARVLFQNKQFLTTHKYTAKPDQTPNQRKYLLNLRSERDLRTKNSGKNLIIKYAYGIPSIVHKENS